MTLVSDGEAEVSLAFLFRQSLIRSGQDKAGWHWIQRPRGALDLEVADGSPLTCLDYHLRSLNMKGVIIPITKGKIMQLR
jgi:hypothetical protein